MKPYGMDIRKNTMTGQQKKSTVPKMSNESSTSSVKEDKSENFLDSLPELQPGEEFLFACHDGVPCFNQCCAELTLPLTPYDVMRMRGHFGMESEKFLKTHTIMRTFPDTGFPLPLLRMLDTPKEPCPFVTHAGCSIYANRPGACRTYPLGRGTKLDSEGNVAERFFIVQEPHCKGFDEGKYFTAHTWLKDQGLEPYNESNDRYMRIMARVKKRGVAVSPKMATMIILCLYQLDRFRTFLAEMQIFAKLEISTERCTLIMADDVECLNFAYEWLELVIFGSCETLKRKES